MANVLPPQYKRIMWRAQRARFVAVLSLFILGLAGAGLFALAPSYLTLEIASPQAVDVPETGRSGSLDPTVITRAHALVRELSPLVQATSSPTSMFASVLTARPEGVAVDSLAFSLEERRLVVSGSGPREAINAYRNALSEDPRFASVSVPVGALVGSGNGRFSITVLMQ